MAVNGEQDVTVPFQIAVAKGTAISRDAGGFGVPMPAGAAAEDFVGILTRSVLQEEIDLIDPVSNPTDSVCARVQTHGQCCALSGAAIPVNNAGMRLKVGTVDGHLVEAAAADFAAGRVVGFLTSNEAQADGGVLNDVYLT